MQMAYVMLKKQLVLHQYIPSNFPIPAADMSLLQSRKSMGVHLAKVSSGQTQFVVKTLVKWSGLVPKMMHPGGCVYGPSHPTTTTNDSIVSDIPSQPQCTAGSMDDSPAPYSPYTLVVSGDSEGSESNQGLVLRQHATLPSSSSGQLGPSAELPALQVQELEGMSLMISFQPDLKLFILWADHLIGHIFKNHRHLLPHSLKQSQADTAVTNAHERLQAAPSPQLKVTNAAIAPIWLGLWEQFQPMERHHMLARGPALHLFWVAQYFIMHVMLCSVGPDHLFSKFYSMLPAWYIDGAFIDGDVLETSDPSDLSSFLTTAGWAQVTEGCSIPVMCAMSSPKVDILDIHYLARIKGLSKRYLSTISSTSDIEPTLLDALTSWIHPPQDWGDMDFADEVDEDTLCPEGDLIVEEEDPEESPGSDFSDNKAAYPVVLNDVQVQLVKTLREHCVDLGTSKAQLMDAYHSVILLVFTTNTNHNLQGPLHSLIDSFIMSTSIDIQGHFVPPHLISSHLAKLIYAAMFSILTQVMKASDPYQTFMSSMKQWMEPGIMYYSVYQEMTCILDMDLLFGAGDAALEHLKKLEDIVDQPHKHRCRPPVKIIMSNDELCSKYFSIDPSRNSVPRKGAWEAYLGSIENFKEHFYYLLHQIPGMPKQGSEEIWAKIIDTSFHA
ncbi:hypothetical protein EDB19DRAFT_1834180 [Suillus lakei]|nr:hypothetical protein EDB19DRAFT_1834180 [Suillus lakei]